MFVVGDVQYPEMFAEQFGCDLGTFPSTYLGLPLGVRAIYKALWDPVVSTVTRRLSGWKAKTLSFRGRLTLVKSVLSSLPIYYMSMFRAPVGIAKRLENIQCHFLWEGFDEQRRLHLVRWELVKAPKSNGGLGVLDLKSMNSALLAKWSLEVCGRSDWCVHWGMNATGWYVWRWIIQECPLFWEFGHVDPGEGWVSFWYDFWVKGVRLSDSFPRVAAATQPSKVLVCDFLSQVDMSRWEVDLSLSLRGGAKRERQMLLAQLNALPREVCSEGPPSIVWSLESSGIFSVKSLARELIRRKFVGLANFPSETVWIKFAPPRVACFMW
ncbi:Putative ribonuclease H protein At1g65750 [Linum perenne]